MAISKSFKVCARLVVIREGLGLGFRSRVRGLRSGSSYYVMDQGSDTHARTSLARLRV